jgi:exodeoxyribonuclease VII large subunit
LEDLWAFNEEIVVRAIYASRIPVISAVGHEIDVTLADLVADVRALTPSEAAERVVPARDEITALLQRHGQRLAGALRNRMAAARARLDALAARRVFRRPLDRVQLLERQLDELQARAQRAIAGRAEIASSLLSAKARQLESLSPLAVLGRGYSLTTRLDDGQLIRSASQVTVGDRLSTRLVEGAVTSRVETIELD